MVRGPADGLAEAGCRPATERFLPAELRPSAGWRQPAAVGVGHRGALLQYPGRFQRCMLFLNSGCFFLTCFTTTLIVSSHLKCFPTELGKMKCQSIRQWSHLAACVFMFRLCHVLPRMDSSGLRCTLRPCVADHPPQSGHHEQFPLLSQGVFNLSFILKYIPLN